MQKTTLCEGNIHEGVGDNHFSLLRFKYSGTRIFRSQDCGNGPFRTKLGQAI